MNLKQMLSTLEAVLFAVGEPIERDRIAQALEWDALILDQLLDTLQAKYRKPSRSRYPAKEWAMKTATINRMVRISFMRGSRRWTALSTG